MASGGKNTPPNWKKDAVATRSGWCHPKTLETLKCYGGLSELQGAPTLTRIEFTDKVLTPGGDLLVDVAWSEQVTVSAGATLHVAVSGGNPDLVLTALAQTKVSEARFKLVAGVPALDVTLSVAAQTITGTIVDQDATAAPKVVSAPIATAAGTRIINVPAFVASVAFDQVSYLQADPVDILVTFSEAVDVSAGATFVITSSGAANPITATALAQTNVTVASFAAVVPSESATLSVLTQTIAGTILTHADARPATKLVTAPEASAAGTRVIV